MIPAPGLFKRKWMGGSRGKGAEVGGGGRTRSPLGGPTSVNLLFVCEFRGGRQLVVGNSKVG